MISAWNGRNESKPKNRFSAAAGSRGHPCTGQTEAARKNERQGGVHGCLRVGQALGCATGPVASGQTPAGIDIQVYAGLTITGEIGKVCSIEYVTDLT